MITFGAGCGLAPFAMWGPFGDICVGFYMTSIICWAVLRLLFPSLPEYRYPEYINLFT